MNDIPIRGGGSPSPSVPSLPISTDAEQKLVAFVTAKIEKLRKAVHIGADHEPTFYEVNQALCGYQDTNLALIALYNTAKVESMKAKERYDDWFAEKFIDIRDRVNPRTLAAQKWYSTKEIEMMVRRENLEEYHRLNTDILMTEQQLAFLRRLLESWSSHQYVLTQLSKNLVAEMKGLGVEDALERASSGT